MTWQRYCASAADTESAGESFAAALRAGDVVLLSGPLGAGKTTFAKGVGRGLGVLERVTSPTFTMVREHRCHGVAGIATLHHADVYRVESLDEVIDLALGELVEESAVALVEWGDLAVSVLGRDAMTIVFEVDDDDGRRLTIDGADDSERRVALDAWAAA